MKWSSSSIRSSFYSVACWGVLLGTTSCVSSRVWITAEEEFTLPTTGLARLTATTHNGSLRFDGTGAQGEVHVRVRKKAGGSTDEDARECLAAIELVREVESDTQKLGWKWKRSQRWGWQAQVSFEVRLPGDLRVDAETHNGAVTLVGLISPARLETHNGRISVSKHHGDLRAESHNGAIAVDAVVRNLRLETHNGSIRTDLSGSEVIDGSVKTNNGSIELLLGDQASVAIKCRTDIGRIRAEGVDRVRQQAKRRLLAEVGLAEGSVEVTTHNGSITVK